MEFNPATTSFLAVVVTLIVNALKDYFISKIRAKKQEKIDDSVIVKNEAETIESLQSSIRHANDYAVALNNTIEQLRIRIDNQDVIIQEQNKIIKNLQQKLKMSDKDKERLSNLETENTSLRETVDKQEIEIQRQNREIEGLRKELSDLRNNNVSVPPFIDSE